MTMGHDITTWIRASGNLAEPVEAPAGMLDRLRYISDLIRDAGPLPSTPLLLHRRRDGKTLVHILQPALTIGRESTCSLCIPDDRLSRRHFEICLDSRGVRLKDLKSRNGTWVNGRKVVATSLNDGDFIEAGDSLFVVIFSL